MSQYFKLQLARCYHRAGKILYWTADHAGDYWLTEWSQQYFDYTGEWCIEKATKNLMEYYWMIDPDAEQDD